MDTCAPHFVSIAVEALRKVLAVHAARELTYDEHIAKVKRMQWVCGQHQCSRNDNYNMHI